MKKSFTSAAVLLCLTLAAVACDQAPNRSSAQNDGSPNKQNEKPTGAIKSYRFTLVAEKCDTFQRSFETQREMCFAIQVPELNNNCAETEREAFFDQHCGGVERDANQAREKILHVDGNSVDCTLVERGLDPVRHFTGTNKLIMEHTSTRALITHSGVLGKISLQLSLRDIETNREIARIQKSWQDEAEPLSLSAPAAMGSPVLTCLVSLAQDPDRE